MIVNVIAALIGLVVGAVVCFPLGIRYRKNVSEREISSAEEEAKRIINEAIKSSESKKREALLEAKEEILMDKEYEKEDSGESGGSTPVIPTPEDGSIYDKEDDVNDGSWSE